MRIAKRVNIAIIALTTSAVVLQGAGVVHAVDLPADSPSAISNPASEVMADVNDALTRVGARPAIEEGTGRGGAGALRTDLPRVGGPAAVSDAAGRLTLDVPAEGEDLAPGDTPRHCSKALARTPRSRSRLPRPGSGP